MAGEGIAIVDCDDPADLLFELADHLRLGDISQWDDFTAAVTVVLNAREAP
jgi:hypothetical protein